MLSSEYLGIVLPLQSSGCFSHALENILLAPAFNMLLALLGHLAPALPLSPGVLLQPTQTLSNGIGPFALNPFFFYSPLILSPLLPITLLSFFYSPSPTHPPLALTQLVPFDQPLNSLGIY